MIVLNTYLVKGWDIGATGDKLKKTDGVYFHALYECQNNIWVYEGKIIDERFARKMLHT